MTQEGENTQSTKNQENVPDQGRVPKIGENPERFVTWAWQEGEHFDLGLT